MQTDDYAATAVSALVRESFLLKGMSYAEVEAITKEIDRIIADSPHLVTYNGTTFDRSFTPKGNG